jgi:hypothetical protein
MYLRIGGKTRPFNEATAPITYRSIFDAKKRLVQVEETWNISGRVVLQTNATQRRMTVALNLLKTDLSQYRPDLVFIEDDGVTESALRMLASECIDGPTIEIAGFPVQGSDVYATGMSYTATAIGVKPVNGAGQNPIVEFNETVRNPQGGYELGFVGGAINDAELQVFYQNKPYLYVQSGSSVGLYGYPAPPPPLWPEFQLKRNQPVYMSPRNIGFVNTYFETQWEYTFGSIYPLLGLPHSF